MYNPHPILKLNSGFLIFFISTIVVIIFFQPNILNTGIDTKAASLCLENMEQKLNISELSVASQQLAIVQASSCLKSVSNIDSEIPEYKRIVSLSQEITTQSESNDDIYFGDLLSDIRSFQAKLENISNATETPSKIKIVLFFCFGAVASSLLLFVISYKFGF